MDTKACNLTKKEVESLLMLNGQMLNYPNANFNDLMERLNYLHKRLKAFDEKEVNKQPAPISTPPSASQAWGNQ